MENEFVKYHNEFNNLALKNFTAQELDLLMSLFMIAKEQDTKKITLTFEQLKNISKYKPTANKRFVADLERTNRKLLDLKFRAVSEDGNMISQFVLFTVFNIFLDKEKVEISINEPFKWVLNAIPQLYTRFELEQFIDLKSQYAKTAYRHLKQYRKTGYWTISIEQFRELMDIPKSYPMFEVTRKVLTPIETELSPIFHGLKIKKHTRGRGGKIVGLEFTFQPEERYQASDERVNKKVKQRKDNQKNGYIEGQKHYSDKDLFDNIFE